MTSPDPRSPPGAKRSPLVTILAALGACVLLAVVGGVVVMLRARREIEKLEEHANAVVRARDQPGQPVVDPAEPAGCVDVQLVPAWNDRRRGKLAEISEPATIQVGAASRASAAGSPVRFEGLGREVHTVTVSGPYLVEPVSFQVPEGAHGAQLGVRAIPIAPVTPDPESEPVPEKVLEVDLTQPEVIPLRWRQGVTIVDRVDLTRSPGLFATLAARFEEAYRKHRTHFDPRDRRFDQAFVRVLPTTPFAEVFPVVEALLAPTRKMSLGGDDEVPAFQVSVEPPRPPRPRVHHPPPDDGPAWTGPPPKVQVGPFLVSGRLPPEDIQPVVATREDEARRCYVSGLRRDPKLAGRVSVRFVIGNDGAVSNLNAFRSDLTDPTTVQCILGLFEDLSFPRPAGGIVAVSFPYVLSPGAAEAADLSRVIGASRR